MIDTLGLGHANLLGGRSRASTRTERNSSSNQRVDDDTLQGVEKLRRLARHSYPMDLPMLLDTRITLRPMSLADVPLLDLWDRQPHVMAATSDDPDQPKA